MSISVCVFTVGVFPILILIAAGLVWWVTNILDLDFDSLDKAFLVGLTTIVEAIVTMILMCAIYGKS